uniref:Envelope small membrane protein n=1 Tax=Alphacoronavirus sp. TaxID=1906673 RepID=A0A8F0ZUE9_9ALPC|nr:envelope protein [Alphacoronavirus sp.]
MLQLIDDHGFVLNLVIWLMICCAVIVICNAVIQTVQLIFTCHRFCSSTVYTPVIAVYRVYQNYMRIDPLPVIDV